MENQGPRRTVWKPKKDNFINNKFNRWSKPLFVPKYTKTEEKKEIDNKDKEKK